MTTQAFLGQVYIPAYTFTVGVTAKTTTAGWYYVGGDGTTNGICEIVQAKIAEVYSAASVSLALTGANAGKVSISFGETGSITWGTATDLRDLLGYSGTGFSQTGVETDVADSLARYVWVPANPFSETPLNTSLVWDRESTTTVPSAPDGTICTVRGNYTGGEAQIAFGQLPVANVCRTAEVTPGTLEQLFLDVADAGELIRYLPDASSYTSTSYVVGVWGRKGEPLGKFTDYARRTIDGIDAIWNAEVPLVKYA